MVFEIYEAKDAYNALPETQKKRIAESKKRLDAIETALVKALIGALPDPVTAADYEQVKEAMDAYNQLSDDQKAQLSSLIGKLEQAQLELFTSLVNELKNCHYHI